ncbi:MAG: bifunctional oligoribonuclease/PAP phosphatase NrnA [Cyclobacteriaceae bacterium]|nr:bifunctional oligoribonuclease/PAP phosphatase NrnA [Cyclobacteriaceae bacterium HetDA_MAG_MS6]
MKELASLKSLLQVPKNIVITTHANPDADALGSSLALYHYLKGRGHNVLVITPTEYPDFLHWMPGNEDVLAFQEEMAETSNQIIDEAEVIFCLDFSSLNRIKSLEAPVRDAKAKKVLVDHHLDPEGFADFQFWDTTAAATAELIYDLIVALEGKKVINADIANCLYAGIMTDTGSFKHPSTTAKVHYTVASLIELGANVNQVSRNIYDTNSTNRLRFTGYALLEKLVVKSKLEVAYFVISREDFKRFNLKPGDTEGLVNYALSIKGIVMATIIIEREDEIRLSFRSVDDFAVNQFANDHFGGGGHKNASGGASSLSLEDTVKKFEKLIITYKEDYHSPAILQ